MAKAKYYQRPDGLFEAIRVIDGKRVAFRGHSCREVDRKILEYKERKEKGRTVKELVEEWQRETEPSVSEATRRSYIAPAKDLIAFIGEKYVKDVKPIDIERYMIYCKDRGYKAGSVKIRRTVCKQAFRYAVIKGDIDVSPVAEISLPRGLPRDKRGSLTMEQIAAVTKYRGPGYLLGIALLYTGCRRGEVLALRYEDIDRKAGTISITRKVSYVTRRPVVEEHLKTEAGTRTIPLLSPLADVLPKNSIGPIFHDGKGNLYSERRINKEWRQFVEGCGLPGHITPHWLRHTFATICYDAGLDVKSTANIMGHANDQTTLEIYTHLTKTREQLAAEKLEKFVKTAAAGE